MSADQNVDDTEKKKKKNENSVEHKEEKQNLSTENDSKFIISVSGNGMTGLQMQMNYWDEDEYDYVYPYFDDLREEILESKFITIEEWKQITLKAEAHFGSDRVKKIKYCNAYNQHGFNIASLMNLHHLIALILYTDYDSLCTFFSTTFKKMNPLESEKSVRQRNGKFYYLSRYLCEAVNDFGIDGTVEKGPFFCGINGISKVGSFAICFYGPASTTKSIEVAMNLVSSDGAIIELQNDGNGAMQKFFDVSWISKFPDEDERLWINGSKYCALRIVTVRVMNESLGYNKYFHALHMFDVMLNGQEPKTKIVETDSQIIVALINGNDEKIPQLIKDSVLSYCQQKKVIDICPYVFDKFFDEGLVNLIMHPLKNYEEEKNDFEDDKKENKIYNVPKAKLFEIFPNLEYVQIWTTNGLQRKVQYPEYRFSLSSFLSFVDCGKSSILYTIFAMRRFDQVKKAWFGQTWLENVDLSSIDRNKYDFMKQKRYNERMNNQHCWDTLKIRRLA